MEHPEDTRLPEVMGGVDCKLVSQRIVYAYCFFFEKLYGVKYNPNWARMTQEIRPLLDQYHELQIAALLAVFFNWYGMDGQDDFTRKRLEEKCFPMSWFIKDLNIYSVYLQKKMNIDINNMEELREFLKSTELLTD